MTDITQVHVFVKELATSTLLNAEFANIYNNAVGKSQAQTISGRKTHTAGIILDELVAIDAAGAGDVKLTEFRWDPASGTVADDDGFYIDMLADNDASQETIFARFGIDITDASDGTEDGEFYLSVMTAGSVARELNLSGAALYPETDDGLALGVANTNEWSDLHLAPGGTISWNNGAELITQTAGVLTVSSATWATEALTASTITGSGILSIDDVTDTTSGTTGSIHTDGGVGIAKALYVGTTSRLVGAVTADAAVSLDDTTDTTSATTGSLHTDGGVGIAKALWVGTTSRLVGAVTCDSTVSGAFNGTVGATTPAVGYFTFVDAIAAPPQIVARGTAVSAGGFLVAQNQNGSDFVTLYGGTSGDQNARIWFDASHTAFTIGTATGNTGAGASTLLTLTSTGLNATAIGATTPAAGAFTTITTSTTGSVLAENVGIGITPVSLLHMESSTASASVIRLDNSANDAANRNWAIALNQTAYGDWQLRTSSAQNGNPITAGVTRLHIDASGQLFTGAETANTFAGAGSLTLQQAALDGEILAFKSSDVAHPFTSYAEADTYGRLAKAQATSGGVELAGYKDADGDGYFALKLTGYLGENADTTHTAAGLGVVHITAGITDAGTAGDVVNAGGNVFTVASYSATNFIVDAEGDLFANAGTSTTAVTVYDDYDDVALLHTYDRACSPGAILTEHVEWLKYNEADLIKVGVLGDTLENGGLTCITRLQQVQNGAIRQTKLEVMQLRDQIETQRLQLEEAMTKLALLERN